MGDRGAFSVAKSKLARAAPGTPLLYDVIARQDGSLFVGSERGVRQYETATDTMYMPLLYGRAIAP